MKIDLFIARRIYRNSKGKKQVSRPAISIAKWGISIGLAVMIVSVSVVIGFKREIREKVIGFGSHMQIGNFDSTTSYETRPVMAEDSLLERLSALEGVKHAQRFSTKPGMIKTEDNFQGIVVKGVGQEYNLNFFRDHLVEGEIPSFSDSIASGEVIISKILADKLNLKLGDKIYTYYIQNDVRARRLTIKGIYQTNFSEYDNLFILTDLYTVGRLNKWNPEQVSGIEIQVNDFDNLKKTADVVSALTDNMTDKYGATYYTQTILELTPQIFAWLGLLDMNVWMILVLMVGVAGFTMISGLLIIILERTNMIGILKAMGADNYTIRKIFLWFSFFVIGRGMCWGNLIGLSLCLLQSQFEIIKLNPETYYVDTVPMDFNWWIFLLLNVGTMLVSVLMLVGPSYLITQIVPSKAIRYE